MDLPKVQKTASGIQELFQKAQLAAQIAKPLIDEAKEKLQPIIDDIKENGLFKRKKRIIALELKSEEIIRLLATQVTPNESQQVQINNLLKQNQEQQAIILELLSGK